MKDRIKIIFALSPPNWRHHQRSLQGAIKSWWMNGLWKSGALAADNFWVASAARSGLNDSTKINKTFDWRIKDLQACKEEDGHCNVTQSKLDKIRQEQISIPWKLVRIKQGQTPKSTCKLKTFILIYRLASCWTIENFMDVCACEITHYSCLSKSQLCWANVINGGW